MKPKPQNREAFSLVEILVVVSVLGVLSGLAYVGVSNSRQAARNSKVQNDVAALNNAIDGYLAAYGTIPPGATAEQVLAKLKTVAAPSSSTLVDFSGPFIDPRLQIVMQSAEEAATGALRADYPNSAGYFYVRSGGASGMTFTLGAASELATETRDGLMSTAFEDRAPPGTGATSLLPTSAPGTDVSPDLGRDLPKLPRPVLRVRYFGTSVFVPYSGESLPLLNYPLVVELSSPVASEDAQLQYSFDGEPFTSSGNIYTSGEVDPNEQVTARVVSLNAARFASSDPISVQFKVQPEVVVPIFPVAGEVPSTLTYAQAGGAMFGLPLIERPPVTVSLSNIEKVPPRYRTSEYLEAVSTTTFTERYTSLVNVVTNAGFSAAGGFAPVEIPIDVTGFGTATQMGLFASVESFRPDFLVVTEDLNHTITVQTTPLSVDILPLKPIGLPPSVTISHSGDVPVGMRKYYTWSAGGSSVAPLNPVSGGTNIPSALSYSTPLPSTSFPVATYTVAAQATGPAGSEHWFTCSVANRTYIAITQVPLQYIGLNMFRANINGYVKGSIYMQAGDFAVLNAGATIEGNVYLPGTPSVFLPASGALVVRKGQAYDQSKDALISSNRITGREYTTEGTLADPQSDLRKIVDLYGSTEPSNYEFRGTETSRIDGKLYRRADPPPVTSEKPPLPSDIPLVNTPVTVSGTNSLGSGSYAVTLNNSNSVLRLGSPGDLTKYVFGPGSTWSAGRVEILGPVQIYFNSNFDISGVTFGSSNSIYQTGFVVMSNYSVSIGSGATVYGQFEARDSVFSVGNDGAFYGSAFAFEVAVSGRGFVDVSGGSDTNAITFTNTP
jgi:prepilin-type N-terminal cleavage/methylation domain-containing protein